MSIPRHLCLLLLLGLLSACTSSKKPKKDKKVGEAKVIGVIELVNPEQNYVLINCEQRVDIATGTEIISQGVNGTDAKLKVTPERKGNYITADITQGTPQLRDLVIYKVPTDEAATPPPAATAAAVVAPMTPVMQADVIPPLDTPFQQMAPLRSAMGVQAQPQSPAPPPSPAPQQRLAPPPPAPPPVQEPEADVSKLPPVIR